MNILIINASSDLYGANRILLQTILTLKPRKIILILPSRGLLTDALINNINYSHVEVRIINTMPLVFRHMTLKRTYHLLKNMYSFKKVIKKIKKASQIDWVYVNTLSSFIVIGILKKLHLKILLHVHEILENDKLFTRTINYYSIKWADKIIAVSNSVKLNLEDALEKNNIVTVLNGISDMLLSPGNKNGLLVVSLFGRIKPEKGIWFFLNAISLLDTQTLSKANFNIIGSAGPGGEYLVDKLKMDIQNHSAANKIEFVPFINDIKNELNASDIIVVPSLMKDPFPTVILEAASAGKPVIATNTGGAVQSVINNVTGFLISSSNEKEFADRLTKLINSREARNKMGFEARAFYLNNFTIDIFNRNFLTAVTDFEEQLA